MLPHLLHFLRKRCGNKKNTNSCKDKINVNTLKIIVLKSHFFFLINFMITAFNHYFSEDTEITKALMRFSGIGEKMAQQTLDRVGITGHIKIGNLSVSQLTEIKAIIEQNYDIDNERRTLIAQNIKRLSSISSYRGFRHHLGLPCRGQRTHSNARTVRKFKRIF